VRFRRLRQPRPGERPPPQGVSEKAQTARIAPRTHRGVSNEHLPVYLDEYVFRHNRRGTPMAAFQTLLGLGAIHKPTTYREITRRAA
jgi:hypothetical protein